MPSYTERQVQNALYELRESNGQKLIVPNCGICLGISDLVSVSASDLIYDYEIKLNHNDFLADFNKRTKHFYLSNTYDSEQTRYNASSYCPNYFFFVTPAGMIKKGTYFPRYAGLITFFTNRSRKLAFNIVKPAPRLHTKKMTDQQRNFLERGLTLRYWKLRKKLK